MTSKELFENFVNETENKPYFSTLYDLDMWREDKKKISKDLEALDKIKDFVKEWGENKFPAKSGDYYMGEILEVLNNV